MSNVLIICAIFFLIFSIIGVNLFSGLFYKCVSSTTGITLSTAISTKAQCVATANTVWFNSKVNFDNVAIGFLALFQVATFNGWLEIISDSIQSTYKDNQPHARATEYVFIFYVAFIMVGGIYVFKLITAVIIDNFNRLKKQVSVFILFISLNRLSVIKLFEIL
jgi:hypothetical protein